MSIKTYRRWLILAFLGALSSATAINASATQTFVTLRAGCVLCLHNCVTVQTLATDFGTNLSTLGFSGTTTWHFYSPPLGSALGLTTADKGGGVIYMRNTGTQGSNDFSVTGRMQFFDYDPNTGLETLIVDTGASGTKNVNHGQTVNWAIPNVQLAANRNIAAGHMVHIAMTVNLVAGNPGSFGRVLYNGPSGTSTSGYFPQNRSAVMDWGFNTSAVVGRQALIYSSGTQPDGAVKLSLAGAAGTSYTIEATTNLVAPVWTVVGTTSADSNGLFEFTDHDAANYPCRYFRAVTH